MFAGSPANVQRAARTESNAIRFDELDFIFIIIGRDKRMNEEKVRSLFAFCHSQLLFFLSFVVHRSSFIVFVVIVDAHNFIILSLVFRSFSISRALSVSSFLRARALGTTVPFRHISLIGGKFNERKVNRNTTPFYRRDLADADHDSSMRTIIRI